MNRPMYCTQGVQRLGIAVCSLMLAACAPPPAAPEVVPTVYVSTVRNDGGTIERVLPASLRPRVESELSFRAGGQVVARAVELGQAVRAGQVLGRVDATDYRVAVQAAVEQQRAAEVEAAQAVSDAARLQRLLVDGSVGVAEAERQQARADAAAARVAQARQQTRLALNREGHALLAAPFDGVVTALRFETGQVVADGQPVLSLARPGELELQADVPETMVAGLKDWQATARLGRGDESMSGQGDPPVPLKLRELAPSAAIASRTYRTRFAPGARPSGSGWRMGMTTELHLLQPGRTPGAELPASALLATGVAVAGTPARSDAQEDGRATPPPTVWMVDAKTGTLKRTAVRLLSQSTDHVRVAGLPDGALVVSVGAHKLDAGLKVRAVQRPLADLEGPPGGAGIGR